MSLQFQILLSLLALSVLIVMGYVAGFGSTNVIQIATSSLPISDSRDQSSTTTSKNRCLDLEKCWVNVGIALYGYYIDDPHTLYFRQSAYGLSVPQPVAGADIATFKILDTRLSYIVAKDKDHVICNGTVLLGADPNTLRIIDEIFIADKHKVYQRAYYGCTESAFDAATFQRVSELVNKPSVQLEPSSTFSSAYYKDAYSAYFADIAAFEWDGMIADLHADPDTFTSPSYLYGRDKNAVYYLGYSFSHDSEHFEFLTDGYSRDSASVYIQLSGRHGSSSLKPLPGANPSSFALVDSRLNLSKDALQVYAGNRVLKDLAGDRFAIIIAQQPSAVHNSAYGSDGANVFYFEVYETDYGSPQNRQIEGVDAKSFVNLDDVYAKDKDAVYARGKRVPEADPATLVSKGGGKAEDVNAMYLTVSSTYELAGVTRTPCTGMCK